VKRRGPVLVVDNEAARRESDLGALAVCVVSLEGVGRITSQFGSQATGAAIQTYLNRLEQLLREGDQLIQINESKHCLLLKGLQDANHARLAGLKLERLFAEALVHANLSIRLAVRAGIACGEGPRHDAETLFRVAETARETAVAAGRVFEMADPLRLDVVRRNWRLNEQLDEAIKAHDLRLYYQPKVSADGATLCGAEGLIRWQHQEGLLVPGDFLPHLDAASLQALTGHVIRQCVRDLATDPTLPGLSFNLPLMHLLDTGVRRQIHEEMALWSVEPARLTIEVTEGGLPSHAEQLQTACRELRDWGVRIAMDDFGTGHSALRQFRDLPVDELKIDRSFVAGIEADAFDDYVSRLMIDLGHFLGMTVVAEGVESAGAARALAAMGCDQLQGFFFSPPLPLDAFAEWRQSRG